MQQNISTHIYVHEELNKYDKKPLNFSLQYFLVVRAVGAQFSFNVDTCCRRKSLLSLSNGL